MKTMPAIIKATPNDIATIRQIAHCTWPVAYGNIISQEQIAYMLEMIYSVDALENQMKNGQQFYLVLLDNKAIGFAAVSQEGKAGCKLNKLYVLPDIQKSGAGKVLLEAAIAFTKQQGDSRLFLQVNKYNDARYFYEKMGFTIASTMVLDIGNGYVMDDYIMELLLPA